MATVNIHDAKTQLSSPLARVENGETITIARAGRPVADLIPHRRIDIAFGPYPAGFTTMTNTSTTGVLLDTHVLALSAR